MSGGSYNYLHHKVESDLIALLAKYRSEGCDRPLQTEMSETAGRLYGLSQRMNDINNDIHLALGRLNEALELLAAWSDEYPDNGYARASRNLIERCKR